MAFRFEDGKDITEEQFENIVSPFVDACSKYLEEELIPLYISFYLSEGYNRSAIWSTSYDILINSALDVFNSQSINVAAVKSATTKLLEEKYKLRIISEYPLDFERIN